MNAVKFEVLGLPSPQGSKRHVGNGRMVASIDADADAWGRVL